MYELRYRLHPGTQRRGAMCQPGVRLPRASKNYEYATSAVLSRAVVTRSDYGEESTKF